MKKLLGAILSLILVFNIVFTSSISFANNDESVVNLEVESINLEKQSSAKIGDIINIKYRFKNKSEIKGENIKFSLSENSSKSFKLVSNNNTIKEIAPNESIDMNFSLEILKDASSGSNQVEIVANMLESNKSKDRVFSFAVKVEKDEEKTTDTNKENNVSEVAPSDFGGGSGGYDNYAGVGSGVSESSGLSSSEGGENTSKVIKGGKPKLIVDNYTVNPNPVKAGEAFDVVISFYNTNKSKAVKNIKIVLNSTGETSTPDQNTNDGQGGNNSSGNTPSLNGSIFMPVNSSNTFYIDSVGAGKKATKTIKMTTPYGVNPNTYELAVNLEYEDSENNEYNSVEALGINVFQEAKVQVGTVEFDQVIVNEQSPFSINFYNTGRSPIYNMMIKVTGDFTVVGDTHYIGNFQPGSTENFSTNIIPNEPGEVNGKLVITYEDSTGQPHEMTHDFTGMAMDGGMEEDPGMMGFEEEEKTPIYKNPIFWIIIALVITIIIVIIYRLKKKSNNLEDELVIEDEKLSIANEEKEEDENNKNIEETQVINKGQEDNED